MAPVIRVLRENGNFDVTVLATGQHTDMLVQALSHFCCFTIRIQVTAYLKTIWTE